MAKYVDGFVLVVPKDKVEDYRKMAEEGAEAWMRHGALEYYECRGEDLANPEAGGMKALDFTELAKAREDETVWFSFIVFKSRAHRDEVNKKVMDEMQEKYKEAGDMAMPFDMSRMAHGGFEAVVQRP